MDAIGFGCARFSAAPSRYRYIICMYNVSSPQSTWAREIAIWLRIWKQSSTVLSRAIWGALSLAQSTVLVSVTPLTSTRLGCLLSGTPNFYPEYVAAALCSLWMTLSLYQYRPNQLTHSIFWKVLWPITRCLGPESFLKYEKLCISFTQKWHQAGGSIASPCSDCWIHWSS